MIFLYSMSQKQQYSCSVWKAVCFKIIDHCRYCQSSIYQAIKSVDHSIKSFDHSIKSFDHSITAIDHSIKAIDHSIKAIDLSIKSILHSIKSIFTQSGWELRFNTQSCSLIDSIHFEKLILLLINNWLMN